MKLNFPSKVVIILFMGFTMIMLAIGGLLDLFDVPMRKEK